MGFDGHMVSSRKYWKKQWRLFKVSKMVFFHLKKSLSNLHLISHWKVVTFYLDMDQMEQNQLQMIMIFMKIVKLCQICQQLSNGVER